MNLQVWPSETKGGVIIKNRKFQFDQLQGELISQEVEAPVQFTEPVAKKVVPQHIGPIRQEVYRPSREDLADLQRQGFRLTLNKPYPIF